MSRVLPILFNTEMVRSILKGRKSETRRLVKPQPGKSMVYKLGYCVDGDKEDIGKFGFGSSECGGDILFVKLPCQAGDILYVRETWREHSPGFPQLFIYKANYSFCDVKWKPSIHMPKEAARIWLKVTDVRAERLQDIDDSGIVAEGLEIGCAFEDIWNANVKKTDMNRYGWNANPWVWVIEFEQCEKPEHCG